MFDGLAVCAASSKFMTRTGFGVRFDDLLQLHALVWIAAIPIFVYRLIVAYWKYLRFRHVIATILITQFVVALAVFTAFLYGGFALHDLLW
jgi:hypothetical protein